MLRRSPETSSAAPAATGRLPAVDWLPNLAFPILSLAQLLQRLVATALVIAVHGWAAAALAERLGDRGPRDDGRRRLNPLAHLDLLGLLHAMFFRVTWMARLDVDASKLRGGIGGAFLMTIGASGVLAAFAGLLLLVRPLLFTVIRDAAALTAGAVLTATAEIAIVTAVVHVLPVPPFVGAAWAPWGSRVPRAWQAPLRALAIVVVTLVSLAGFTDRWAGPIRQAWRTWLGF
jgi:hypothetical protein